MFLLCFSQSAKVVFMPCLQDLRRVEAAGSIRMLQNSYISLVTTRDVERITAQKYFSAFNGKNATILHLLILLQ